MTRFILKRRYRLLFLFFILVFAAGCETISSFQSGDVKVEDMGKIINPQIEPAQKQPKGAPVLPEKVKKADDWLRRILW